MGNFNKGKKFGAGEGGNRFGGRNFGDNRGENRGFGGGRRGGDRPEMHKATCSDCGNSCEVPFRPTGEKPVFCNDCFKNKGGDNSRNFRGGGGNRDFGNRNSRPRQNDSERSTENYKAQFEQLNTKLDKILNVLNIEVAEEVKEVRASKSKKFQKTPNKEIDATALKEVIEKTMDEKPLTKKAAVKKPAVKKTVTKKKATDKKTKTTKKK